MGQGLDGVGRGLRAEQVGRVVDRRAPGDDVEVAHLALDLVEGGVAQQEVGEARAWPAARRARRRPPRRRSAETSSTRRPPWAMATARLAATVVLPSSATELVMATVRAPPSRHRQQHRGAQAAEGVGLGSARGVDGDQRRARMAVALGEDRDAAQRAHAERGLEVGGAPHPGVEPVHDEGGGQAQRQPGGQGGGDGAAQALGPGLAGQAGRRDDRAAVDGLARHVGQGLVEVGPSGWPGRRGPGRRCRTRSSPPRPGPGSPPGGRSPRRASAMRSSYRCTCWSMAACCSSSFTAM